MAASMIVLMPLNVENNWITSLYTVYSKMQETNMGNAKRGVSPHR
jgi:hypothetical protein